MIEFPQNDRQQTANESAQRIAEQIVQFEISSPRNKLNTFDQ